MLGRSIVYGNSARYFLDKKEYNASVICYYYAVLQRMMYSLTISKTRPIPLENQNPMKEDAHERTLTDIKERVQNSKYMEIIEENFRFLQELRERAEYKEFDMSIDDCLDARGCYDKIISKLESLFRA